MMLPFPKKIHFYTFITINSHKHPGGHQEQEGHCKPLGDNPAQPPDEKARKVEAMINADWELYTYI